VTRSLLLPAPPRTRARAMRTGTENGSAGWRPRASLAHKSAATNMRPHIYACSRGGSGLRRRLAAGMGALRCARSASRLCAIAPPDTHQLRHMLQRHLQQGVQVAHAAHARPQRHALAQAPDAQHFAQRDPAQGRAGVLPPAYGQHSQSAGRRDAPPPPGCPEAPTCI